MHNEEALIAAFVKRSKRERYREILASPRLRHKFTSRLAHFVDFESRYRVPIPTDKLFVGNVATELRRRRCPSTVFAISEDPRLDQRELPLLDALEQVVGSGFGTVLSCIPGRLAFVETEDERFILAPMPRSLKDYARGLARISNSQPLSDGTNSAWASAGLRLMPLSTYPACGRWPKFSSATAIT